jgi:hypothetical protein
MEGVEFEENQTLNSFNIDRKSKPGGLTRFFIKLGLAKDQEQANVAMIIVSVFCLLLMSYFIISTFFPGLFNFNKPKSTTSVPNR